MGLGPRSARPIIIAFPERKRKMEEAAAASSLSQNTRIYNRRGRRSGGGGGGGRRSPAIRSGEDSGWYGGAVGRARAISSFFPEGIPVRRAKAGASISVRRGKGERGRGGERERRDVEEEGVQREHHDAQGLPRRLHPFRSPSPVRSRRVSSHKVSSSFMSSCGSFIGVLTLLRVCADIGSGV